jgi:hypothetical protein
MKFSKFSGEEEESVKMAEGDHSKFYVGLTKKLKIYDKRDPVLNCGGKGKR